MIRINTLLNIQRSLVQIRNAVHLPLSISLSLPPSSFPLNYSTHSILSLFSMTQMHSRRHRETLLLHRPDASWSCLIRPLNFPLMHCCAMNDENFAVTNFRRGIFPRYCLFHFASSTLHAKKNLYNACQNSFNREKSSWFPAIFIFLVLKNLIAIHLYYIMYDST